jgi:hypothetical protein
MPTKLSDDEFIALWQRSGSASEISKITGLSQRAVYGRRRSLEARLGVSLASKFPNNAKASWQVQQGDALSAVAAERARRYERDIPFEVQDGEMMIASDCHYWPGIVTLAHTAFCKLAKAIKPKVVILNGDVLDGARISRHARIMWEKQPDLKDEIYAVQDRVAEIERAAAGAKFLRTIGNHDARFENYLSGRVGEFEEMTGMTLLDYLPRWESGWAIHLNPNTEGWVTVRHRPISGGVHSAYNSTLKAGVNYVHGHLHKLQVTPWADYRGRRYGVDTGTLAEPEGPQFNYTEAGPLNWASGFAVLTFRDGKLLQPELCVVEHGKAWFRGVEI